jgi:hypothetical protein
MKTDEGTDHAVDRARLRRGLLGLRSRDVEAALEEQRRQTARLAERLEELWLEREELRSRLAAAPDAAAKARADAAEIVASAERQAERIRRAAVEHVSETTSRVEDLLHVREQLLGEMRGILRDYGRVLDRAERHLPLQRMEERHTVVPTEPELAVVAHMHGAGRGGKLYPRKLELDVGPFADFTRLSSFERALSRLPKVRDVYIRSYRDERALIELELDEERPIVEDLALHLPLEFDVVGDDGHRLTLAVQSRAAAQG